MNKILRLSLKASSTPQINIMKLLSFLIFEVEATLLFPFMISFMEFLFWSDSLVFLFFLFILSLGLFYEWNQKFLEWVV